MPGLAVAAVALLLLAAVAEAASGARVVRDPRFDTPYLSGHGRVDITRATAARDLGVVRHSVTMRSPARPARPGERPAIIINTRGGRRSPYEYIALGSTIFRVPARGAPRAVGAAALTSKRRRWSYRFDLDDVPGLGAGYGWAALTQRRGGDLADVAPDRGYVPSP
ncbi:MAG: hypothetical protein EDQ89_11165 [Acidobacteria bacterium]|nr:MAG: hypothetical protein EDQ89_11165 [Acidobacteriota bacterium]GIK78495.1 MAG: hypothetical protein BroJett022_21850 [Actinomycetes bacterium]